MLNPHSCKSDALIAIPIHNGLNHTAECLRSLAEGRYPPKQILVVDNESTDGSADAIRQAYPESEIVIQENTGFGAAANVAIRVALSRGAPYTWLLNNDTRVPPGTLEELMTFMDRSENRCVGACSPVVRRAAQPDEIEFCGGWVDRSNWTSGHFTGLAEAEAFSPGVSADRFLSGCALLIRNQAALDIGMFDERFFMYWEDVDFCLRLLANGYQLRVVPSATVLHTRMGSSGEQHPLHPYYSTRNRFLMRRTHGRATATRSSLPRMLWSVFRFFAGVSTLGSRNLPGAVVKGAVDGLLGRWGRRSVCLGGVLGLLVLVGSRMVGACVRVGQRRG